MCMWSEWALSLLDVLYVYEHLWSPTHIASVRLERKLLPYSRRWTWQLLLTCMLVDSVGIFGDTHTHTHTHTLFKLKHTADAPLGSHLKQTVDLCVYVCVYFRRLSSQCLGNKQ